MVLSLIWLQHELEKKTVNKCRKMYLNYGRINTHTHTHAHTNTHTHKHVLIFITLPHEQVWHKINILSGILSELSSEF